MSNEKIYSLNGEDYNFNEMHEAIDAHLDESTKKGDIITVYEGDKHKFKAGDFFTDVGSIIDDISCEAFEIHGEYSEDWPDFKNEGARVKALIALGDEIRKAINIWADNNKLQPTFSGVKNVREIKVKLTSDDGEYVIIKDSGEN